MTGTIDRTSAIRSFDEAADAALRRSPPTKDWVRASLRRQGAARCPVRLRRLSFEVILRHGPALAELLVAFPDDVVFVEASDFYLGPAPADATSATDVALVTVEPGRWTDEWGTEWEHADGGVAASSVGHPLDDWGELDHYLAKRMPDPEAPDRLRGATATLEALAPTKYLAGVIYQSLFERFHALRGMESALTDLYLYPRQTERLLDALTDFAVTSIQAWGARDRVDAVYLTDDWGTQTSLMISPALWRRYFAERYRRLCDAAHGCGMDVIFHSCGQVGAIIGDLIDVGVDVVDPLQPEALDLVWVAREFGGKVAFSGGLGNQALARSSPAEVRDRVRRAIDTLGSPFGNAYLLSPSNTLLPDVPLENITALFEACHTQ